MKSEFSTRLTSLTRNRANQRTLDSITNTAIRLKQELSQLGKDIEVNVLEYSRAPGALNHASISQALKLHLWSEKDKLEKKEVTEADTDRCQQRFADMDAKIKELEGKKKIDRLSVKE